MRRTIFSIGLLAVLFIGLAGLSTYPVTANIVDPPDDPTPTETTPPPTETTPPPTETTPPPTETTPPPTETTPPPTETTPPPTATTPPPTATTPPPNIPTPDNPPPVATTPLDAVQQRVRSVKERILEALATKKPVLIKKAKDILKTGTSPQSTTQIHPLNPPSQGTPTVEGTISISTDRVFIRQGCGTNYDFVGHEPNGKIVTIDGISEDGQCYHIKDMGFIARNFVTFPPGVNPDANLPTKPSIGPLYPVLNLHSSPATIVRNGPSQRCEQVDSVIGRPVIIIGSVEGDAVDNNTLWYHIRYELGKQGYVHSSRGTVEGNVPMVSVPSTACQPSTTPTLPPITPTPTVTQPSGNSITYSGQCRTDLTEVTNIHADALLLNPAITIIMLSEGIFSSPPITREEIKREIVRHLRKVLSDLIVDYTVSYDYHNGELQNFVWFIDTPYLRGVSIGTDVSGYEVIGAVIDGNVTRNPIETATGFSFQYRAQNVSVGIDLSHIIGIDIRRDIGHLTYTCNISEQTLIDHAIREMNRTSS